MAIKIIASLRPGVIAVIMEAITLTMGLLAAWNLKAIVALNARCLLLRKGRAKLRDLTFVNEIVDGIAKPWRLLQDWRSMMFFFLLLTVAVLDVLAVLQTQPGLNCDFREAGSFTVQEKRLGCLDTSGSRQFGSQYLAEARKALQNVDLDTGVPANTNAFENSVLSKASVEALKPHEKLFSAPLMKRWSSGLEISLNDLGSGFDFNFRRDPGDAREHYQRNPDQIPAFGSIFPWIHRRGQHTCPELQIHQRYDNLGKKGLRDEDWGHLLSKRLNLRTSSNGENHTSTGVIAARACRLEMWVYVCLYERSVHLSRVSVWNSSEKIGMKCDVYEIDREGRQTAYELESVDSDYMVKLLSGEDTKQINSSTVRRAMLTSIVAQNSASQKQCKRFIAVPKPCTQVGWVSFAGIVTMVVIVFVSSGIRLALVYIVRKNSDWCSDWRRLVGRVFDQFSPTSEGEADRGGNGAETPDDEIHVSIVESKRSAGLFRLVWSRGLVKDKPMKKVRLQDIVIGEADEAYSELKYF